MAGAMAEIVGKAGRKPEREHEIYQHILGDLRRIHDFVSSSTARLNYG
jgi:hypothetical protein